MRALEVTVSPEHPAFDGHFPGAPLLPGVALLAVVLEAVLDDAALAARVGGAPRLSNAKFLAPVRPGARLSIVLEPESGGALRFDVREGARLAASGRFETAAI